MKSKSQIKVLGSGSNGNCLAIYNSDGRYILIDVGLPYKTVLSSLEYNLKDCVSVVCSHDHLSDHTKSLNHFIKTGIPCYGNQDICKHHNGCNLLPKVLNIDGFKIQNFELVHNAPNNAFIIDTSDGVRILYCTDTEYIPKKVKGVHYAIIECNYDFDCLISNAVNDSFSKSHYENHQSLDSCIEYLKLIYSADLQCVVLWHLSSTNINWDTAKKKVQEELGFKSVFVAKSGLEIELNACEF